MLSQSLNASLYWAGLFLSIVDSTNMTSKWTFQAEPGYFQDLAAVENQAPGTKITTQPQLALLPRKYPTDSADAEDQRNWVRFAAHVVSLNEDAPDNVAYKVLYLTRHGLGYHNKKHIEVGTAEWDVSPKPAHSSCSTDLRSDTGLCWTETRARPGSTPFSLMPASSKRAT